MHADAVGERVVALAADGLALARRERGEEIVEARVAGILPVELLVGALQESEFAEEAEFRLGREGHVNARGVVDAAKLDQAGRQRAADFVGACGPGRTSSRRPVAGVNGTATWSFG